MHREISSPAVAPRPPRCRSALVLVVASPGDAVEPQVCLYAHCHAWCPVGGTVARLGTGARRSAAASVHS
jgi:hypothetical protein